MSTRWERRDGRGLLSEAQQKRYQASGITKRQYQSKSFSLEKARGHSATPEHPGRLKPGETKYRAYENKRLALARELSAKKTARFGGRPKFNAARSHAACFKNPVTGKPRGLGELRKALVDIEDENYQIGDQESGDALQYH